MAEPGPEIHPLGLTGGPPAESKLKILYILGSGRSGSTLLAALLGEMDGFFDAGELRAFWTLCLPGRRLCGCGLPVRQCNVWSEVLARMPSKSKSTLDEAHVRQWQMSAIRLRHTHRLLRTTSHSSSAWPDLRNFVRVQRDLLASIREVTGARSRYRFVQATGRRCSAPSPARGRTVFCPSRS